MMDMIQMPSYGWLFFCLLACMTMTVAAQDDRKCYFPDGTLHEDGTPCYPDNNEFQHCCGPRATCLSNYLCLDTKLNHIVRSSCTDQTFSDDKCGQYCTGYGEGVDQLGNLRQCDNTDSTDAWVCSLNTSDTCADQSNWITVPAGYVKDGRNFTDNNIQMAGSFVADSGGGASSSSAPVSSQGPSTTSVASSSDATNPPVANGGDESQKQQPSVMTVGVAVGLSIGIPLLLALGVVSALLIKARKRLAEYTSGGATAASYCHTSSNATSSPMTPGNDDKMVTAAEGPLYGQPPQELSGAGPLHEMDSTASPGSRRW